MNRNILLLLLLSQANIVHTNTPLPLSTAHSIDGFISEYDIYLTCALGHAIHEFIFGKTDQHGNIIGLYTVGSQHYSVKDLFVAERDKTLSRDVLKKALLQAKKDFVVVSKISIALAQSSKKMLVPFIQEFCEKRDRMQSQLLQWSHVDDGQEQDQFLQEITSFQSLHNFYIDLLDFLNDLCKSCHSSHKRYESLKKRAYHILEQLPITIVNTQQQRQFFLYIMKKGSANVPSYEKITPEIAQSLWNEFTQT